MTRTLARQMSAPVPSPSMNGMIGLSGTASVPFLIVILAPWAGGVTLGVAVVDKGGSPQGKAPAARAGRVMLAHACRAAWRVVRRGTRMRDSPCGPRRGPRCERAYVERH